MGEPITGQQRALARVLVILIASLLVYPLSAARAQCPWSGSPRTRTSGGIRFATRTAALSPFCVTTAKQGLNSCASIPGTGMVYLFAWGYPMTITPAAYCQWDCNGTRCRIDLVDGLPVELMEFSVEGAPDPAEAGARGDDGQGDSPQGNPDREGT